MFSLILFDCNKIDYKYLSNNGICIAKILPRYFVYKNSLKILSQLKVPGNFDILLFGDFMSFDLMTLPLINDF